MKLDINVCPCEVTCDLTTKIHRALPCQKLSPFNQGKIQNLYYLQFMIFYRDLVFNLDFYVLDSLPTFP